ncbi:MAG: hypothetical protein CSA11_05545 [Chloroflexi bacterium]|nr:MAG: hypothetical protein CSA11_05545 [Chloroflexota bacterium]
MCLEDEDEKIESKKGKIMARRIFGAFLILMGIVGILFAVLGVRSVQGAVTSLGEGMDMSLDLAIDSLDAALGSLLLTRDALADVEEAMEQVEGTVDNVGTALDGTEPILTEIGTITTVDLPNSLAAIEDAVPNTVQAADAIDSTLITLNNFEINTDILGFPIQYDLGIDYEPTVSLSASVQEIGLSLEGMPARLRELDEAFIETQTNLETISQNMDDLSGNLKAIKEQIAGFTPFVDDFIRVVTETSDNLRLLKAQVGGQVAMVNTMISLGMIWLVLSQVVPLYLGYELVFGRLSSGDEPVWIAENADKFNISSASTTDESE